MSTTPRTITTGLARVTVAAPRRTVDLALPEHLPLAELLPELLHRAGDGLADEGERHGGWQLRRVDGQPLNAATSLAQQGIRDGEVLHLLPMHAQWPEPAYDDLVEAIAAGARLRGRVWSPDSTKLFSVVGAGLLLAVGLVALVRTGPPWAAPSVAALVVALALLLAAVVAARAYGDSAAGAALGGFAVAYAAVGGFLVIGAAEPIDRLGSPHLLIASTAGLLFSVVAAVGVGAALRVFVATGTLAAAGMAASAVAFAAPATGAAAIVLSAAVLFVPVVPTLALRLGRVPLPVVTRRSASGHTTELADLPPLPDRESVFAAVARTDEMLTGLIMGGALTAVAAGGVLVTSGSTAGRILVAVTAGVLTVRARAYVAVAQRLPLLVVGVLGVAVAAVAALGSLPSQLRLLIGLPVAVLAAVATAAAGAVYRSRPPSPYLSRFTDILDGLLVISVVPVACAVLDLFDWARGLSG